MSDKRRGGEFEVGSVADLQRKYGLTAQNRSYFRLSESAVPAKLRPLIPYAEYWGVGDDIIREDLVRRAPSQARRDLRRIVAAYADELDDWLAGPEADLPVSSREYIAFSNMRIAAEEAWAPDEE